MDERPFAVTLRPADARDAETLASLRTASECERHPERLAGYGRAESFVRVWLAYVGPELAGTAYVTIVPTLPRYGALRALDARVRNVYVLPAFRRRGVATLLVRETIAEAERARVDRLTLGTSVEGLQLYRNLGFVLKGDEMVYRP